MTHQERYREAVRKALDGFVPDLDGVRDPARSLEILRMLRDGMLTKDIATQLDCSPKAVQKTMRRMNLPTLHNICPPLREERIGWAGGVKEVKGYLYSRTTGHPLASKHGGYVAVHRLVIEEKIGRFLLSTEVVDHIDGNTRNNHPDNLRVFASNAEHLAVTLKGRCPKWSDDGKERIRAAVTERWRRLREGVGTQPSHVASETDADL